MVSERRVRSRWAGVSGGIAMVGLMLGLLVGPPPFAASADAQDQMPDLPTLQFAHQPSERLYGAAYDAALENLQMNTISYDPDLYGASGLMNDVVGTFVRAGGGYDQPWTRDASVNSWNAASLLEPEVAKNTLWAVVNKGADGQLQVQQDEQQWDQVVWMTAAWNHYLITGDKEFLRHAYQTAQDTLRIRENATDSGIDSNYRLFTGAAFFNDGISGYPAPPADATESHSIGRDWPLIDTGMFLSTNALYYEAYVSMAEMAASLGRPAAETDRYRTKADKLKEAINAHFWNEDTGLYDYMILADGTRGEYQEGAGLAFTLLFGIADDRQTRSILENVTTMPWGMPDTYPNFARYSDAQPGRHNAIVWPLVQGLWGRAVAAEGDQVAFARQMTDLARLADNNSGFWEVYNGNTGVVDGGWQRWDQTVKFNWGSEPDQTWSATGYLSMIYDGLFGLRFTEQGLTLQPHLPAGWGDVTLEGLRYRDADLTIRLRGAGTRIESFSIDGSEVTDHRLPGDLTGGHTVEVTMAGANGPTDRDGDGVVDRDDACPDMAGSVALRGCPDPERMQAEDAENVGGAKTAANHQGFDGRAFVDSLGDEGVASRFVVHRATSQPGYRMADHPVRECQPFRADAEPVRRRGEGPAAHLPGNGQRLG